MAGDWIKMRTDLVDDPSVIGIAATVEIDEDVVIGKLHRIWSWADRHTTDGRAPGITPKWVDRYVACQGFADAMAKAGWLLVEADAIIFPHFDRHNGESAKRRADNALRQRISRADRDKSVTNVTRELIPRPFARVVKERDAYVCVYCGTTSDQAREASHKALLSVDHIIPLSRGGKTSVDNLACCCRLCNNEKNDRTPEEWGMIPKFLQPGVTYVTGKLHSAVTNPLPEKRREEKKKILAADAAEPVGDEAKEHRRTMQTYLVEWAWPGIEVPPSSWAKAGESAKKLYDDGVRLDELKRLTAVYWPGVDKTPSGVHRRVAELRKRANAGSDVDDVREMIARAMRVEVTP